MDGASNSKGDGVDIVLVMPKNAMIKQGIREDFEASNYEAEYEALLAIFKAHLLGENHLDVYCNSNLVSNKVTGDFSIKDEWMAAYLQVAHDLMSKFKDATIQKFPRGHNSHIDALATLTSVVDSDLRRTFEMEFLANPSIVKTMVIEYILTVKKVPTRWNR